jgi:hypothetical protein
MDTGIRHHDSRSDSRGSDTNLLVKALKNTFELLGGAEQKENLFKFLRNEYGLSLERPDEITEKNISKALTALFGSGAELLIYRLREELAMLKARPEKSKRGELSDVETLG